MLKTSQEDLERQYNKPDPWGYRNNPADILRKNIILRNIKNLGWDFQAALDIGCGEGWITQDLPANHAA